MGRGPNKSKKERTIIASSYMAGLHRVECNKLLALEGYSPVKQGYWDMTSQYAEAILDPDHPYTLAEHVNGAPSLSALRDMIRITSPDEVCGRLCVTN